MPDFVRAHSGVEMQGYYQVSSGTETMPRVLIIAYGNPLRSDDGVAWRAAEQLQNKFRPGEVEIQTRHQLCPELAEPIQRCELVIFVDAAAAPGQAGEVLIEELQHGSDANIAPRFCHSLSPAAVLGLARQLYAANPKAFSATVTGENFSHGERLSPLVQAALPEVVHRVEELVHTCLRKS